MDQYGFGNWNIPRRGILKVHGENGAQSLQMQPDDNCDHAGHVKALQALFLEG